MLKKQNIKVSRRRESELQSTPGEVLRDTIIKAGIKTAEESGYVAGNKTDVLVGLAQKAGSIIDSGTAIVGGSESGSTFARIAFKTTKDLARGDNVYTGLCFISGTCEAVAVGCSTIKAIPLRGQIYVGAKIINRSCMTFRNLCAGEGC